MLEAVEAPIEWKPKLVGGVKRRRFKILRAHEVEKKLVDWLWRPFIAKGNLTLLTGDPQAGKSTFICDLIAALSRGRPLPGESEDTSRAPIRSWILSSEDDAGTTISWRLDNQGADMTQILITDVKVALDDRALVDLEEIIFEEKLSILFIDTVTTWMGGDVDMNSGNQTMAWLSPLKEIAQRTGCAIVLVRHRRKGAANDNKLHAGAGSHAFTAAVRSEIFATMRKDKLRVIERAKGNIGAPPPKYVYEIVPHEVNEHGVLKWTGATEASDYVPARATGFQAKSVAKAKAFLSEVLGAGPLPSADVIRAGAERQITEAAIARARPGLASAYQEDGKWWMKLEPPSP